MQVLPVDRKTRQTRRTFERKKLQKISLPYVILHGFGSKVMKINTICNYIEKSCGVVI